MGINVMEYNPTVDVSSFVVSTESELTDLPNLTDYGKGGLVNMDPVKMGSTALVVESSAVFILDSDNTWKEL